jgi:hypothetical protein
MRLLDAAEKEGAYRDYVADLRQIGAMAGCLTAAA